MKLVLKDFQEAAASQLVTQLRRAAAEAAAGDLQAVSIASPTGSGKTIMVTAAIERIIQGDGDYGPDSQATFLWITDQPELNEQTKRKMLTTSTVLNASRLVTVDATFDQETFRPGIVYFLNIQKLGKEKDLVSPGDDRTFTIWETITNTIQARPGAFYIFIDEAHRGMGESARARAEATTIVQKFIKGSPGEIPPAPLVLGISATPERFNSLIQGTSRISRPIVIRPEDVRASGLLKEVISVFHPQQDQPSDMTMLRAATQSWQTYAQHWAEYCPPQGEPVVRPILVVQVQDGSGNQVSKTDIAQAIQVVSEVVGTLPDQAFAHAFQEGATLRAGDREVRYLAPADIDGDRDVQVIFFKTSLNTGWDCPRAEVMMSFRTAMDATLIAQLVGRMVRTPLARRIDVDEYLNMVALYLPHYDETGLSAVVGRLTTPDPDIMPPVEIEAGENLEVLTRATGMDEIFAALANLPSYVIPRARKTSEVRRLMKLARLLAHDELRPNGPEEATVILLNVLRAEYEAVKDTAPFQRIVAKQGKVTVRSFNFQWLDASRDGQIETVELDIAAENVDDLFDIAGRKLGEGLHKAWWRARVEEERQAITSAKLELFALCTETDVVRKVEAGAQATVQQWLNEHNPAIAGLSEGRQQAYNEVRMLAGKPEIAPRTLPDTIESRWAEATWPRHVYVNPQSVASFKFNGWETAVLEQELAREDVVGWLRNIDRKPWSVCVPYRFEGEYRALYPDFLFVRLANGSLVVDMLEPHSMSLADAPAKAAGLAEYAAEHWYRFGRIELIIVDEDGKLRPLNLSDERIRNKVRAVQTHAHLRQLFAE